MRFLLVNLKRLCQTQLTTNCYCLYITPPFPPTGIYCLLSHMHCVSRFFARAQNDDVRREVKYVTLTLNCGASRHHNPSPFGTSYHLSPASGGTMNPPAKGRSILRTFLQPFYATFLHNLRRQPRPFHFYFFPNSFIRHSRNRSMPLDRRCPFRQKKVMV